MRELGSFRFDFDFHGAGRDRLFRAVSFALLLTAVVQDIPNFGADA